MENATDIHIKNSFSKVKEDINFLNSEILDLKLEINNINLKLDQLLNNFQNKTNSPLFKTNNVSSTYITTDNSTVPQEIEGLKPQNLTISTGNRGVSTDRQTIRQTDNQTDNYSKKTLDSDILEASEILESLDNLKKGIRLKFKGLTPQEMAVFSTIYQLEEQNLEVTYKLISKNLRLSESSIRDYVQRMINKGISIQKTKINNKKILLFIAPELKKIASLSTIIRLRDL